MSKNAENIYMLKMLSLSFKTYDTNNFRKMLSASLSDTAWILT